jgi:hypothetical protein
MGKSEQERQNRHQLDDIMNRINRGESPETAIQNARMKEAMPDDTGLAGLGQKVSRFFGGKPKDMTYDLTAQILMGKLENQMKQQDLLYQTQVEAARLGNQGKATSNTVAAKTVDSTIRSAEAGAKVAEVEAAVAPVRADQSVEAGAQAITAGSLRNQALELEVKNLPEQTRLDIKAKTDSIANDAKRMGWASEDVEMKKELFARERMLEARKLKKDIDNDEYDAEMRLLEIKGKKLDNKYRKSQANALDRKGTRPPDATMRGVYDDIGSGKVNESNEARYRDLVEQDGYILEKVSLPDTVYEGKTFPGGWEYRVTKGNAAATGGAGGETGNPTTTGEQTDYSGVPMEDLLKSLMNDPNLR